MTDPVADTSEDPTVTTAVTAVQSLVDNAKALGLTWTLRPGRVAADTTLSNAAGPIPAANAATVILDGDTVELEMVSLVGPLLEDQRVMVAAIPPGGLFVIGSAAMDPWHVVADAGTGFPDFEPGWSNFGAPGGSVGFRRTLDGHLELTGLADFTGTAAAPNIIFTLPEGWRPDRQVSFITSNNPGTAVVPTPRSLQILTTGEVQVTNYAGSIDPGLVYLDGIYVALRTDI